MNKSKLIWYDLNEEGVQSADNIGFRGRMITLAQKARSLITPIAVRPEDAREELKKVAVRGMVDDQSYIPDEERSAYKARIQAELRMEGSSLFHKIGDDFSDEEKIDILDALGFLPLALTGDIKVIKSIGPVEHMLRARITVGKVYGEAELLIPRDFNNNFDRKYVRFAVRHEVGGHGILGIIYSLSPAKFNEIKKMWMNAIDNHPGLLDKDRYASKTGRLLGKLRGIRLQLLLRLNKSGSRFIPSAHEEFIANRMAEFFTDMISNTRNLVMRDSMNPFSPDEEQQMADCCRSTYRAFLEITEKKKGK